MALTSGAGQVFLDGAADAGAGMLVWSPGTASAAVTTSGASDALVLRARGDQCSGAPIARVSVNGVRIADVSVPATSWTDHVLPVSLPAGTHRVAVAFINDYFGGCDRNLRLDRVVLRQAPAPAVTGSGTGLRGAYYSGTSFETRVTDRVDARVDFDFGSGSPASGVGADNFSVRWQGEVQAMRSETYTFHTVSDDGIRLWVGDRLLIDQWGDHGPTEHTAAIALEAGKRVPVKVEYYERGGGAGAARWLSCCGAAPPPRAR